MEYETWENDRVEMEEVLQDARPDQLTSTSEVQYNDEDNSYFLSTTGPGSVEPDEDYGESKGEEAPHSNIDIAVPESEDVSNGILAVSYTHLTLPTNREV